MPKALTCPPVFRGILILGMLKPKWARELKAEVSAAAAEAASTSLLTPFHFTASLLAIKQGRHFSEILCLLFLSKIKHVQPRSAFGT